jgi:hypothetical protein
MAAKKHFTRRKLTPNEKAALVDRIGQWCHDNTESWQHDNIGVGLAYLFWAICGGFEFDFDSELWKPLLTLLKKNKKGLLKSVFAAVGKP